MENEESLLSHFLMWSASICSYTESSKNVTYAEDFKIYGIYTLIEVKVRGSRKKMIFLLRKNNSFYYKIQEHNIKI